MRRLKLKSRLKSPNKSQESVIRRRSRYATAAASIFPGTEKMIRTAVAHPVPLTVLSDLSNKYRLIRKQRLCPSIAYPLAASVRFIDPLYSPWRGVPSSSLRNPCRSQQQLARGLCTLAHSTVYRWTPYPHPANVFQAGLMKTVSKQRHVRKRSYCKPSDQRPVTGDRGHKSGSGLESVGHRT